MRFRVELLHHPKPAKLPLCSIEIAMMIGIARDEAAAPDPVIGLHPLYHMDGEWKPGYPRMAVALILQVEPCRRRVLYPRFCSQIVAHLNEQVRLLRFHQIDVAQRSMGLARQR